MSTRSLALLLAVGAAACAAAGATPYHGSHAPSDATPVRGTFAAAPVSAQARRPARRVIEAGCLVPEANDPAYVAEDSSAVVWARVASREPAQSVIGHPVTHSRHRADYAWHDFILDDVKVIWRADDAPHPGETIRVRVYGAKTPELEYHTFNQPQFRVGERYVLCLWAYDLRALKVGPPRWTTTAHNAFLLVGDKVQRKGVDKQPFTTVDGLLATIARGTARANSPVLRAYRASMPQGIKP